MYYSSFSPSFVKEEEVDKMRSISSSSSFSSSHHRPRIKLKCFLQSASEKLLLTPFLLMLLLQVGLNSATVTPTNTTSKTIFEYYDIMKGEGSDGGGGSHPQLHQGSKQSSASTTLQFNVEQQPAVQADEPSNSPQDNNNAGEVPQVIKLSSKKSPQSSSLVIPILDFNSSSSHRISSAYQNVRNNKSRNNELFPPPPTGGGQLHIKPRRLESLSYGLKRNSIAPFVDEEEETNHSAKKLTNLPYALAEGGGVEEEEVTVQNHVRRTALQIRRDLSRLVAKVGAGLADEDSATLNNKCDRVYISTANGPKNGTFDAPSLPMEEGNLYTCMLMFVARPNERVDISFHSFDVRGTPPECVHEWVDMWTEVEGTDPTDLITTPFSGRYCGRIPPRKRISLYGGIAVGLYSDKNSTDEPIFQGSFAFINESRYVVGTPVPRTLCSYTILSSSNKGIGELLSPTYPGVYPKNLNCSYKFIGSPGQRIRIEFRDFDVFYGGAHCPFDDVKIYDGQDPTSPLIGTYCGQQRNLVVYSSEHTMLVSFTVLDRQLESQNRGFNAVYEFSNSFVKLDFIEKNMGDHIRGTECDQRILSKGQSNGVVYSPNYPFPYLPKIVCRYFVYGFQDAQNLERVRISFEIFDVPSNINSGEDEVNQSDAKRCGDGFLKVYLKGQEVIQAYDKADYEFCGKELPHSVVSDGPRMVLVFSSGETQGSGFKGKYIFETEYRVPGTEDPTIPCHFTYYSKGKTRGEFNSPRFPSNYPSGTNCTYMFYMENSTEQVRIVFDNFKLRADKFNVTTLGAYGSSCEEDWVEIWNVMAHQEDRLVGRYCSSTAPGPVESREQAVALKVLLHTDDEHVYSGFKARYMFFETTPENVYGDDCGGNISQSISGEITSPLWPHKYEGPSSNKGDGSKTCNWYMTVRPGNRVMLDFQHFTIEGDPPSRGCASAAVRIWEDIEGVPIELCGPGLAPEISQYVSTRNTMRVTFILADKAVGAPGFRAIWTEVQDGSNANCHSSFFRCSKSQFCIPTDLKCDGTRNCGIKEGEHDQSDEEASTCSGGIDIIGDMNMVFSIGAGALITLVLVILICAWVQRRKRKRRRRLQLRRPPIHVCDNAGARFAAMDSV